MVRQFFLYLILVIAGTGVLPASVSAATADSDPAGFTRADQKIHTGLWWNPKRPGQGIDIHFSGERLFVIWYTFDIYGYATWYTGTGEQALDGSWQLSLLHHHWDHTGRRATPTATGQMTLRFEDARHGQLSWVLENGTGSEAIELFTLAGTGAAKDRTGAWYAPDEPGYGLTVSTQGSYEMLVFYFYDANGDPRWVLGHNGGEAVERIELFSYHTFCPSCPDLDVNSVPAGSIHTEFQSETEGRVELKIQLNQPVQLDWRVTSQAIRMLSNPPSGRLHPAALAKFASAEALERYLEAGLKQRLEQPQPIALEDSGLTVSAAPPPAGRAQFSTTNLQEQGVDEADRVKTDGRYLYVASQSGDRVRILKLFENPYKTLEKATLMFGDNNGLPLTGLYLVTHRAQQQADLLVTVHGGETHRGFAPAVQWDTPYAWINGKTEIRVFDVSNPEQPVRVTRLALDGSLIASRRIGDSVYLVTRFTPNLDVRAQNGDDRSSAIETLLGRTGLQDLLPSVQVDTAAANSLTSFNQTFLPPFPDEYRSSDLITVSRIQLGNPTRKPDSLSIVGQSETVYVSTDAMYIATSRYAYRPMPLVSLPAAGALLAPPDFAPKASTEIHKISLTEDQPVYRGSASIEGYLDGGSDTRPFRLSEHEGVLRVVSSGGHWGELGDNRLTLLQESNGNASSLLTELSHLPNATRPQRLGKPGERLYATRFVGKRLFLVTFLQTDPLFTVDLSDAHDPKIQGELEIPGYSDYLHPLSENLLLGIGKDAIASGDNRGDGQFAWYQGIRIGLFDVSGSGGPLELDHVLIGQRGSESELLQDHHAFAWLPPATAGEPTRFALPISVHGAEYPSDHPAATAQVYRDWQHSGLYLFEVDVNNPAARLNNTGALIVKDQTTTDGQAWMDMLPGTNRSLLLNDGVFFSHQGRVWSAPWQTPELIDGPK